MADNPFSVDVPNPVQALLLGQQAYDAGLKRQQEQNLTNARQQAVQAYQGGDAKGALATLLGAGDREGASLMGQQLQNEWTRQHTAQADAESARRFGMTYGLQKQAADRANYEFEHTPDQYVPNPNAGKPGEPAYTDQYAQATAAAGKGKPIPYETLGGTKFLVPLPGGGYTQLDPRTVGAPVPSSASVVGDAEGVARGLYDAPGAPGQRPPIQGGQPGAPQAAIPQAADLEAVDPNTGRREAWLNSQPPDVQQYIKKIADYQIDPRTTSIKGGHREQVLSAVAQYDPSYDQNTFGSRAKAIRDFATGQQGNSIRSFDVATDHLDTLQKYVDALKNGSVPAINAIRNRWMQETGSSLPTNVQAVAPIVGAEVSKAIIGSNNALADREELRLPLQSARSPEQLAGAIQGYKALMTGQLRGLKKQYEDTTGKKDFNNRLRDNTRNVLLGNAEGGDSSSKSNVTSTGIKWSIQ